MRYSLLLVYILLVACTSNQKQEDPNSGERTWTYTYLKANPEQRDNLKQFLEANWLKMDSIAVAQGLFNDYQLLSNTNTDAGSTWDFIVAVEYFTAGTYEDIAEQWSEIRKNHKTVLVNGYGLESLGTIVKSETLTKSK